MSRKRGSNSPHMRLDDRRIIDAGRSWYAVQTAPMRERAAATAFIGSGVSVWLPHYRCVTIRRRKTVERSGLFFPRYLFAGLTPEQVDRHGTALMSRNVHVTGILGNDTPMRMPAPILQALSDRLTGDTRSERLSAAAAFRVGEMRQLIQGPFSGFLAQVTELLATGRVKVDVTIFNAVRSVEVDPQFLDAA